MTTRNISRVQQENMPRESRIHLVKRYEKSEETPVAVGVAREQAIDTSSLMAVLTVLGAAVPLIWLGKALLLRLHLP